MSSQGQKPKLTSLVDAKSRQRLVQMFFFAILMLLLWQTLRILAPFYVALLGSAILSMLVYPLHAWVLRKTKNAPNTAAILSTSIVVLIFVLPILLFGWVFIKEASKVYPTAQEWFAKAQNFNKGSLLANLPPPLLALWTLLSSTLTAWNIDLQEILLKNLDELSTQTTVLATHLIKNTFFVIFNLMILVFTLFFFLRDGPFIIRRVIELVPMAPNHKQTILERLQSTLYAVIRGVLLVALVQGTLAGIGYGMFGVPFPVLLGAITTLLAPIPFVGIAGVWLPVALCLLVGEAYYKALYVCLWNLLVVGTIDNLLRPILIGAESKIPILLLFFGMLGGLRVYGFTGLLVGPILIALMLAFINIYRQEYQWLLSDSEEP